MGRGIWEAYQHGAFREGSRLTGSLGRMLANSDGPDRAEWESGESGGTREKRLRLERSEEGYDDGDATTAFDEEDPATVWCRLGGIVLGSCLPLKSAAIRETSGSGTFAAGLRKCLKRRPRGRIGNRRSPTPGGRNSEGPEHVG